MASEECDSVTAEDTKEAQFVASLETAEPHMEMAPAPDSCNSPLLMEEGGEGEGVATGHFDPHDYVAAVEASEAGGHVSENGIVATGQCDPSELADGTGLVGDAVEQMETSASVGEDSEHTELEQPEHSQLGDGAQHQDEVLDPTHLEGVEHPQLADPDHAQLAGAEQQLEGMEDSQLVSTEQHQLGSLEHSQLDAAGQHQLVDSEHVQLGDPLQAEDGSGAEGTFAEVHTVMGADALGLDGTSAMMVEGGQLPEGMTAIAVSSQEGMVVLGPSLTQGTRLEGGEYQAIAVGSQGDNSQVDNVQIVQQALEGGENTITIVGQGEEGEAITMTLEQAAHLQYLFRQQTSAMEIAPGTYQIFQSSNVPVDGELQGEGATIPLEVMQSMEGEEAYPGAPHIVSISQESGVDASHLLTVSSGLQQQTVGGSRMVTVSSAMLDPMSVVTDSSTADSLDPSHFTPATAATAVPAVKSSAAKSMPQASFVVCSTGLAPIPLASTTPASVSLQSLASHDLVSQGRTQTAVVSSAPVTQSSSSEPKEINVTIEVAPTPKAEPPPKPAKPKPDLSNPIPLFDSAEVVINGKKCMIMMDPETQQPCAYPLLPPEGKRRRGRPRKQPVTTTAATTSITTPIAPSTPSTPSTSSTPSSPPVSIAGRDTISTQTPIETVPQTGSDSAAVQGLLELSNPTADGIRRSGRKRTKARTLDDYEILEISSDEEPQDDDDDEVTLSGVKRRKTMPKESNTFSPFLVGGVKRGRGRPRRYPPPGQTSTTSIPAVIIPTANGQTLMMAPIQGLSNLQAFHQQVKALPQLLTKSVEGGEVGEGTTTVQLLTSTAPISAATTTATSTTGTTITLPDGTTADGSFTLDSTAASSLLDSSSLLSQSALGSETEGGESLNESTSQETGEGEALGGQQATYIQIPESLMPQLLPKKDPIKLGLKASESDLDSLRCLKCQHQSYYPQQYQKHIATHGEDIHRCKCCHYLTFDKDSLLKHFKENHPRCICHVCDFMAEHAYVIKRHMMRHNAQGCTCELCGKTYKDQYILKMHVRMVHMPAEVLYECNVCCKKFTRKAHLKRHMRIHDPEKPYKCSYCDYRGCERSDITKHLLIHQEPKHECEVCHKTFRHIKNKELHVKRHKGQRDYKCGVCDFYGYTFTDIRKHIERKHSDMKTLSCEKCSMPFKSEAALREHQKQPCDVLMIEHALAISSSSGGRSQATIQIPSSLAVEGGAITIDGDHISVDGQPIAVDGQHISVDGQHISVDGQHVSVGGQQITMDGSQVIKVKHVGMTEDEEDEEEEEEEDEEEEEMSMEEGQVAIVDSEGQVLDAATAAVLADGQMHVIQNVSDVEAIITMAE